MQNSSLRPVERALVLSGGAARGAFQVGVCKYLEAQNWRPDLICGSSVGAIHAAALAAGLTPGRLEKMWLSAARTRRSAARPGRFFRRLFRSDTPFSFSGSRAVRDLLEQEIDFDKIRSGKTELAVSAVDLAAAETVYFDQSEISVNQVLASAAAPLFFPWQSVGGKTLWDGGVMANTPILPALARGAQEIVAVFLSPVGAADQPPPRSARRIAETTFEQMLLASFQATLAGYRLAGGIPPPIHIVAPSRMLGFSSLGNYSERQVRRLIEDGYKNARRQLEGKLKA